LTAKEEAMSDPTIDWSAAITLQEASAICGLSVKTLRNVAVTGEPPTTGVWLRTTKVGARLHTTTRRALDDYLKARGGAGLGPLPKPLPDDYQAPPPVPRRGRPRKNDVQQKKGN
jgi:hypothetical protein